jgi:hypothetical protein
LRTIVPLASNLQSQDYRYKFQTLSGYWSWVTRLDVSQASPKFEVRDVFSPFGLLRDSVPIPGEVVQAMNDSIDEIQQAFAPSIFASPTSFTFTVDEGRGFSGAQQVQVSNNGVYGSLLSARFTTTDAYLRVSPSTLGGLSFNEGGVVDLTVDSTNLTVGNSPYAASVTIQDAAATNSPMVISVATVVRPKANIQVSPTVLNFTAVKPLTGDFPPVPSQSFVLTNTGPSASLLDYLVQRLIGCSDWLVDVSPFSGTLTGGSSQSVLVTVAPTDNMGTGTYTETLRVSGYSENSYQDVTVTLTIS